MSTSLSSFVDNLSEISNKSCSDKKWKSECEFKGYENYIWTLERMWTLMCVAIKKKESENQ